MKRFLPALFLSAACGAGLVDHAGVDLQIPGGQLQCTLPQKDCGGTTCVSLDKDPNNCGACTTVCATPQNATNKCEAGTCGFTCNPGFFLCGDGQRCCPAGALAAGGDTTCAVVEGSVRCWGANDAWQLGSDPAAAGWSARPVPVPGVSGAGSVAVGLKHACAILAGTGEVMCWGANGSAQLGVASGNGPVKVPGVSGAQSLALGDRHSCAAKGTGVVCWGANDFGQLGQGTVTGTGAPAAIASFAATSISAGTAFTCAVSVGDVYCWGTNSTLQFGESTQPPMSSTPFRVNVSAPDTAVAAGDAHGCAIGPASKLYCWGAGASGQIGDGKVDPTSSANGVSNISSASLVAAGAIHTCAVSGGSAFCWGGNNFGQLGVSSPNANKPVQVGTLSAVQEIALGANHSCAQNGDGAVYCWGNNGSGQAGAPIGGTIPAPRPID